MVATRAAFAAVLLLVAVNVHAALVLVSGRALPSDPVELALELFLGVAAQGG